jgi:4-alpha-glucanotransferase
MDDIFKRASVWGFDTAYRDAFGNMKEVEAGVFTRLLDGFPVIVPGPRAIPASVVLRGSADRSLRLSCDSGLTVRWTLRTDRALVADGEARAPTIALPSELPEGIFRLEIAIDTPAGEVREQASLIVCPQRAFQGGAQAPHRMWALAFQLYAVRSQANWGHGDFADLLAMVDLAADLGAAGVGLNPLHALFDDAPEQASPYSPSSRLFLNPLYIALDQVPEFPGAAAASLTERIDELRTQPMVDYRGVAWREPFHIAPEEGSAIAPDLQARLTIPGA